jgi:hypothetical protein
MNRLNVSLLNKTKPFMEWRYPPGICENLDDYILRKLLMPKEKGTEVSRAVGLVRVAGEKGPNAEKATHLQQIQ